MLQMKRLIKLIIKRLLAIIPTILGVVTIIFFLTYYIPADPVGLIAGPFATSEQVNKIKERYKFDDPIHVQYLTYIKNMLKGDLGESLYSQRDIASDLKKCIPATLEISLFGLLIGISIGTILGVISAIKRNSFGDHIIRIFTIMAISIATFWIAIEFQNIFFSRLKLLPLIGRISRNLAPPKHITGFYLVDSLIMLDFKVFFDSLTHMILPGISLSLSIMGIITRMVRSDVLSILESDFVVYAKSVGLSNKVLLWKHILKNASTTAIAQIGLTFGYILSSTFVVEKIFMWPGLGSYALDSILYLDYKAVYAIGLWTAIVYAIGGLLADIALFIIDPREISK